MNIEMISRYDEQNRRVEYSVNGEKITREQLRSPFAKNLSNILEEEVFSLFKKSGFKSRKLIDGLHGPKG